MVNIGLCVPVYKNFEGFTRLMASISTPVLPIVVPNYEENKGCSYAWNIGLHTDVDILVISNDDIEFAPGSFDRLVNSFNYSLKLDLVSIVNTRDSACDLTGFGEVVDFSCFAVRPKKFLEKFGLFDENFFPAYFEDNDMHRRINLLGGVQKVNLEATAMHHGSVTQNWDPDNPVVPSQQFEINRSYYVTKWGGWPGSEMWEHPYNNPEFTPKEWKII